MSEFRLVRARVQWIDHGLTYQVLAWVDRAWVPKLCIDGHAYQRRLRNRRRGR